VSQVGATASSRGHGLLVPTSHRVVCRAYGLGVWASQPLSRLEGCPGTHQVDLTVWLQQSCGALVASGPSVRWFTSEECHPDGRPMLAIDRVHGDLWLWSYAFGLEFVIDHVGREVWATWTNDFTIDDVSSYLLGPLMGFILRLRHRVSLHASAMVVDGRAVAIVGPPGAGKSTTAAAFGFLGYPVLSDDVVPLLDDGPTLMALPGYPRVRLRPAAIHTLSRLPRAQSLLPQDWQHGRYHFNLRDTPGGFQDDAVPLGAVYVFEPRREEPTRPRVTPLTGLDATMALVSQSFAGTVLNADMRARDFEVLSRVAMSVPVRRVEPHSDPDRLEELCRHIVADARALAGGTGASVVA